jgi:uncharacterized membrane protein YdjX (TVP38/TMEM64 family)
VILISLVIYLIVDRDELNEEFSNFMEWMKDNVFLGFLVFTGIVFMSTILFIPGSIVLMGCGFAFA